MTAPAIFTSAALSDVDEAVAWIVKDTLEVAIAFRDATIEAARMLGKFPSMGAGPSIHGADRFMRYGAAA